MRTLQEIENCGKEMLVPADVAGYLGCNAYNINITAQSCPELLGFPVCMIGRRVKIPRAGFVQWAKGLEGAS